MSLDDTAEAPYGMVDCTTTSSFTEHGVDRGSALIQRTYYRLAAAGLTEFESTDRFFDQLEAAFTWAYIASTGEPGVPPHVEAAVEDALAWTRTRFDGDEDVDVRTELLPRFYSELAAFHCAYRGEDGTFEGY